MKYRIVKVGSLEITESRFIFTKPAFIVEVKHLFWWKPWCKNILQFETYEEAEQTMKIAFGDSL